MTYPIGHDAQEFEPTNHNEVLFSAFQAQEVMPTSQPMIRSMCILLASSCISGGSAKPFRTRSDDSGSLTARQYALSIENPKPTLYFTNVSVATTALKATRSLTTPRHSSPTTAQAGGECKPMSTPASIATGTSRPASQPPGTRPSPV